MELIFQSVFKSPKTTIAAVIGALVWICGQFGIVVTKEVADAAIVLTVFVIGFLAKDATTSGQ